MVSPPVRGKPTSRSKAVPNVSASSRTQCACTAKQPVHFIARFAERTCENSFRVDVLPTHDQFEPRCVWNEDRPFRLHRKCLPQSHGRGIAPSCHQGPG